MIIRKEVIVTLSFLREATDLVAQYKSKLMAIRRSTDTPDGFSHHPRNGERQILLTNFGFFTPRNQVQQRTPGDLILSSHLLSLLQRWGRSRNRKPGFE